MQECDNQCPSAVTTAGVQEDPQRGLPDRISEPKKSQGEPNHVDCPDSSIQPQTTVPVKYCTNPTTGVVEPVDDSEEDFAGDPRRSPRAELLQKGQASGFSQKQLLQQQQLLRKPAPQTVLEPPFLPVPSVITGGRSGAGGRLGRFGRNKERLLRGRANSQLF